jgi:hypothetical protein
MPKTCCAVDCSYHNMMLEKLSFHKFQKDENMCILAHRPKFNNLISQFDWYKLLSICTQNINMMCVRFTEKYLEFARVCIPTKTITIRDRDKPWFNSGIKREMKIRDSLHKKMRKQPNIFG